MPTEIFLSYRRSDATGNARFLHDQLLLRFDSSRVFFDLHTLGAGEVFPDEIHNALRECSVLLALIGPGWVGAERDGKLRLHDPLDFVRREIALALELGKQVIPVLLESAAEPAAADLPPCLASLALRQAHTQRGSPAEYASSLERLIDRVSQLPGVSPPSALRRATGVRIAAHQLPLLCDRSGQNDAARDALRTELQAAQPRPMVLVLHGRVDEEHHAFVERLERFSLPRFLKGTPFAAGLRVVRIHEPLRVDGAQADFDLRLRERLGEALDIGFVADDATLLRHAQQQKITALLAVLTWRASDFAGDPGLAIERVFGYWSQLPAPGPRLLAGCIVCLKYDRDRTRVRSRGPGRRQSRRRARSARRAAR